MKTRQEGEMSRPRDIQSEQPANLHDFTAHLQVLRAGTEGERVVLSLLVDACFFFVSIGVDLVDVFVSGYIPALFFPRAETLGLVFCMCMYSVF